MKRSLVFLIGALFLISGSTGLIYETLWIRILSLGVGSTSSSMSLVLSIFFLGLALGSYLSGRFSHKMKNPLKVYGILESIIGIYAVFLVFPLIHLHQLIAVLPLSGSFSIVGLCVKFLIVGALLILPTVCMGATFPILIKLFLNQDKFLGKYVSRLYALNTFGAVIGAFSTGYFLIPYLGILNSNFLAAALNLTIGGTAIYLSAKNRLAFTIENQSADQAYEPLGYRSILILASTFVCGFVSISSEVIWNKYLNIFLGTNIYGIGLVLALFLLGIAIGSFLLSFFVERIKNQSLFFVWLLFFSGVSLLVSSLLLNYAPQASITLQAYTRGLMSLLVSKTLVVTAILFLPTCLFGMLFPLTITLLTPSAKQAPGVLGFAYAVNTMGAILGSYLTGIVLIPILGSSATLMISLLMGCLLLMLLVFSLEKRRVHQIALATCVFAFAIVSIRFTSLDYKNLIKSAYQQSGYTSLPQGPSVDNYLKAALKPYSANHEDFKLIIEGETAVISLSHDPADGERYQDYFRLKTSGLNESVYNMQDLQELPKYEALIAFLPYLFSKAPKQAFVVGYGGGFTVDFLTDTDLKKVNVVELEKGILKAADYIYKGNNPLLERPNLNLKVEDARYVLAAKLNGPQDIIVSQPSHSWLAGAANLFTQEFFEVVKENLAENGVFSQWLNLYNMDVPVLQSILKTFYTVFPHGAVFTQHGDQELVLLGSRKPLDLNLRKLEMLTQNEMMKGKLTSIFDESSFDIVSLFSLSREDVLELTKESKINTDMNAYAEVQQSKLFYRGLQGRETPQQYLSRVFKGDYRGIVRQKESPDFYYNLLLSLNEGGHYDKFNVVLNKYEAQVKDRKDQFSNLGFLCFRAGRFESALDYLTQAFKAKADPAVFNLILSTLTEQEKYSEIATWYKKYPKMVNESSSCFMANAYVQENRLAESERFVSKYVLDVSKYTGICGELMNKTLGTYFLKKGDAYTAIPFMEAYYKKFPNDISNLKYLVSSYERIQDANNLKLFQPYLSQVVQNEVKQLQNRKALYQQNGFEKDVNATERRLKRLVQSE